MGLPSKYGVGLGSKQKDGGSKTAKRVGHPHKICCPDGSNSVRNNGMTVRTRQTAWDILTKIVVLTVPTRVETMGWRFENGWDILTKMVVLTVPRRFETIESFSKLLDKERLA